jgi:hypothetical protein
MRFNTFGDCAREQAPRMQGFRSIPFHLDRPHTAVALARTIERFPFIPSDPARLREDCFEAYNIQVQGLATRLKATGIERPVIGVSDGLDSTQALIVAARATDHLGLPRTNVLAYTLPGFATSEQTKSNAWMLIRALGVTGSEIDIRPAARQMLGDLGHPFVRGERVYDITSILAARSRIRLATGSPRTRNANSKTVSTRRDRWRPSAEWISMLSRACTAVPFSPLTTSSAGFCFSSARSRMQVLPT